MKLYFLAAGHGKNSGYLVQGEDWKVRRYPVLCLLVERDNGDLVLIDTGLGSQQKEDFNHLIYRASWFNAWMNGFTKVDLSTEAIIKQLPTHGFDPRNVKTVIVSRLHYDHAGGMKDFPHAKHLVSKREWEAITERTGWSEFHSGCLRPQFEGIGLDIDLISTNPQQPYHNFPASYDVFGDGSVVVVDINGHSPGLIGAFVNLPSGKTFSSPPTPGCSRPASPTESASHDGQGQSWARGMRLTKRLNEFTD